MIKQIIFIDGETGHLFSDARLTVPILCREHESYVTKDLQCSTGKHEVEYTIPYMLFEISSQKLGD
jgi:hypothetical protein